MMTVVKTLNLTDRIDTDTHGRALKALSSPSVPKAPLSIPTSLLMLRKRSQSTIAVINPHGHPPSTPLCFLTTLTRSGIHPEPSTAHSNSSKSDKVSFGPRDDDLRSQNASFPPYRIIHPQRRQNDTPGRMLSKYPSKAESSDQDLTSCYKTHMNNPVRAKKMQSISSLYAMPHKVRSNTLNEIENMENRPAAGDNSRQQSTTADITMMLQTVS